MSIRLKIFYCFISYKIDILFVIVVGVTNTKNHFTHSFHIRFMQSNFLFSIFHIFHVILLQHKDEFRLIYTEKRELNWTGESNLNCENVESFVLKNAWDLIIFGRNLRGEVYTKKGMNVLLDDKLMHQKESVSFLVDFCAYAIFLFAFSLLL